MSVGQDVVDSLTFGRPGWGIVSGAGGHGAEGSWTGSGSPCVTVLSYLHIK